MTARLDSLNDECLSVCRQWYPDRSISQCGRGWDSGTERLQDFIHELLQVSIYSSYHCYYNLSYMVVISCLTPPL